LTAAAAAGAANALPQESAQTTSERAAEQSQEQTDQGEKKDGILSKVNPVRLGVSGLLGLVSALSSGSGGGGRGVATGNAGAGTRASLDPIFSAKLPAPSPQYSGTSFAPRDMRGVDFARYGYGPGASFFENVPRNPEEYKAALAANAPTASAARPSGAGSMFGPLSAGVTPAGVSSSNIAAGLLPAIAKAAGAPLPAVAFDSLNIDWDKFADSKQMQDLGIQFRNAITQSSADPVTSLIRTYIPSATDAEIADFLGTEEGIQFLTNFGAPVGRARGGAMRGKGTSRDSYAVKGAGTGRSDEIPALLSDGEYVIDAETVAMLGDGSSEAGAKRLDDFRINVRKHKGRNLAKGKFSANAKRPEKYLAGGRA
jgi:hypothetical protein